MYKLKKIDVSSVAIYSFIMFIVMSLVLMIPFGLIGMIFNKFASEFGETQNAFNIFSGFFLIVLPILYAILGTIINVLIALLYNLISKRLGGLAFSVDKIGEIENISH